MTLKLRSDLEAHFTAGHAKENFSLLFVLSNSPSLLLLVFLFSSSIGFFCFCSLPLFACLHLKHDICNVFSSCQKLSYIDVYVILSPGNRVVTRTETNSSLKVQLDVSTAILSWMWCRVGSFPLTRQVVVRTSIF